MIAQKPYEVRIASPAFADIGNIWDWTVEHFGHAAALRYESLIDQAIADLAENPDRPGAKERPDLLPRSVALPSCFQPRACTGRSGR